MNEQSRVATARDKLLDAAVHVIRSKGYSAARVEDICAEAGLTKGAFFHHFASKEACAIAAAAHFAANADAIFDAAPYSHLPDARARVLGYVDFRKAILQGELAAVHLPPRHDGAGGLRFAPRHSRRVRPLHQRARRAAGSDIAEAKARHAPDAAWTPDSAALYSQAVLQGRVHSRQGQARPQGRRRLPRPSQALFRDAAAEWRSGTPGALIRCPKAR